MLFGWRGSWIASSSLTVICCMCHLIANRMFVRPSVTLLCIVQCPSDRALQRLALWTLLQSVRCWLWHCVQLFFHCYFARVCFVNSLCVFSRWFFLSVCLSDCCPVCLFICYNIASLKRVFEQYASAADSLHFDVMRYTHHSNTVVIKAAHFIVRLSVWRLSVLLCAYIQLR